MSVEEELENLSLVKTIKLNLTGFVKIGPRKRKDWSDYLDHYILRCKKHGLIICYTTGRGNITCPECAVEGLEDGD